MGDGVNPAIYNYSHFVELLSEIIPVMEVENVRNYYGEVRGSDGLARSAGGALPEREFYSNNLKL